MATMAMLETLTHKSNMTTANQGRYDLKAGLTFFSDPDGII